MGEFDTPDAVTNRPSKDAFAHATPPESSEVSNTDLGGMGETLAPIENAPSTSEADVDIAQLADSHELLAVPYREGLNSEFVSRRGAFVLV